MATRNPIADQLGALYEQCQRPVHHRRIQQRWTRYPALDGITLNHIADVLADPDHPDHNPIAADLLRAHRAGDRDAATVLLIAARPVVRLFNRSRSNPDASLTHLWAAVGKLIATTDPDATDASPKPFMVTMIGRIRRDTARYSAFHTHGYIPAGRTDTDISDHLDSRTDHTSRTENAAIARICLEQIGAHVRSGRHGEDRWQELVHQSFRAGNDPGVSSANRNRVLRLRRHLAELTTEHAA